MAGHSLGEYTALVCADALPFTDAVRLVRRRAELMQAAVPAGQGAMAAVLGLDDDAVVAVCRDAAGDEVVEAVNFNSPGQVVIAGDRAAVERATERAKAQGAKRAVMLNVSVPSHCRLMKPAAAELARALQAIEFATPSIPVLSNVDVEVFDTSERMRIGLEQQLYNPVRWADIVRRLAAEGVGAVIECGPGKVLAGLTKRIDRSLEAASFDAPESVADVLR
jgi:[acyl-carrier-protein] S-malonyltransferase